MSHERRNARRARTGFHDETGPWYVLDNAAIIMPAVVNRVETSLFRMSATLDHPVKLPELTKALERTARRFPYFNVELRRGFFWYFLQPCKALPLPEADARDPGMDYDIRKRGRRLYRVRAFGARVACEFSHALTDGTGGMTFLKTLLAEYFRELGVDSSPMPDIFDVSARPDPAEYEDGYQRFYKPGVPPPEPLPKAFHMDAPLLPGFRYRITSGAMPFTELSAQAKARGATLNELLVAAYFEALLELRASYTGPRAKRARPVVSVEVPVNMRKHYPTRTLRNFSLFVLPSLDARLGTWSFDELVEFIHHYMKIENDERRIARQIARNAGGARNVLVRLVPLPLKDFFAKLLFSALGEALISGLVSNLGPVSLPPELAERVLGFDFIGAPSGNLMTNASVLSWKGEVKVVFGSRTDDRTVERLFFRRMRALGVPVRVDGNAED